MKSSEDFRHHAYLLIGERSAAKDYFEQFLRKTGFKIEGNPDLFVFEGDLFGIDDARRVQERSIVRSFGENKIIAIFADKITLEAQNALLKTLEDPSPETQFFISLREETLAIPTLRSRVESIKIDDGRTSSDRGALSFIEMPLKDRLEFSKKFALEEKELAPFLDELLEIIYTKKNQATVRSVFNLRQFAEDRAPSRRLILEHIAILLSA